MAEEGLKFTITAEDETRAGFQSALNNARRISKQASDAVSKEQQAGLASSLKGVGQAFEPVEKLGKIFTSLQAGAVAFQGISAALRKDWDGVGEAIQQLPFGIGQVSKFAMDFKAEITGARKEVEALGEEAKRIDRETATAQQRNREFRTQLERFTSLARDREREAQVGAAKSQADKIRLQMGFDLEDLNKDLDSALKALEKLGSGPQSRAADMLREQAEKARQAIRQIADQELAGTVKKVNDGLKEQKQIVADVKVQWERWANIAKINFDLAMDTMKKAQERGVAAREDLRGAVADIGAANRARKDREFEIAVGRAAPDQQGRMRFERAKLLIGQAGKAGFQKEESQERLDEALGLLQGLLEGDLPAGRVFAKNPKFLRGQLEWERKVHAAFDAATARVKERFGVDDPKLLAPRAQAAFNRELEEARAAVRRRFHVQDDPLNALARGNVERFMKLAEDVKAQGLRQRRDEANQALRDAAREQFQAIGQGARPMIDAFTEAGRAAKNLAADLFKAGQAGGQPRNDIGGAMIRGAVLGAAALLGG